MQKNRVEANISFTEPVVLMHGTNIPWELPIRMTMSEVSFRDIRVSIAGSELQEADKVFFREQAEKYLERSPVAIENVQVFFNHILGTARRTVADTRYLLSDLEELNSTISLPLGISKESSDDLLTTSMEWLASHGLVYLPVGVEPFREFSAHDPQLHAISLMEKHTSRIDQRLVEELAMVEDLKSRFRELADIADEARERLTERYAEEKRAKIARGGGDHVWRWSIAKIWGTSMDQYLSDQRLTFLQSMGPTYRNISEYLVIQAKGLNSIRNACGTVQDRLKENRWNLQRGKGVSLWLVKRYRVLEEAKEILDQELKGWATEKTQTSPRQS